MGDEHIDYGSISIEVNEETYEWTKSYYKNLVSIGEADDDSIANTDFSVVLKEPKIYIRGYSKPNINPKTLLFQGSKTKRESEIKRWTDLDRLVRGEKYREGSLISMMINIFGEGEWDEFFRKNEEGNEEGNE